jgi:hypothetical protein
VSSVAPTKNDFGLVERIAEAVLYEGYVLYPYRSSSVKNRQRWNFGVLAPESYSIAQRGTEAFWMQTQCMLVPTRASTIDIKIRFLHLMAREVAVPVESSQGKNDWEFKVVPSFEHEGRLYQTWQEAVERDVGLFNVSLEELKESKKVNFSFAASREVQELRDRDNGELQGAIIRTQSAINGQLEVQMKRLDRGDPSESIATITVKISNLTSFDNSADSVRDDALLRSLVSTHTILRIKDGEFVSLLDPPAECAGIAAACQNIGTYPVLAGEMGARECVLSSPIILYDYPQIASESAGDLYDGTEIDEILTLRVMTLTDDEKREMRETDERARQILERTEMLPVEQFMKLHGAMKSVKDK